MIVGDTEEDEGDIDVQSQCSGSGDGVRDSKDCSCLRQVVFHAVVHEPEGIDHDVEEDKHDHESTSQCFVSKVDYILRPPSLIIHRSTF
jgi:hypothetical protein